MPGFSEPSQLHRSLHSALGGSRHSRTSRCATNSKFCISTPGGRRSRPRTAPLMSGNSRSLGDVVRCPGPSSESWHTYVNNHRGAMVAVDFLTVTTATFRAPCVLVVLYLDQRRIVPFNDTDSPTADRTSLQPVHTIPFDPACHRSRLPEPVGSGSRTSPISPRQDHLHRPQRKVETCHHSPLAQPAQ